MSEDLLKAGLMLPLMESFYSIQGEGFHTGKPAYFIRVGGCDIGCRWCDEKRSWNKDLHPLISIEDICNEALKTPAKAVVVTGGEPMIYNLKPLTKLLKSHNIETFLETSGSYPISGQWDWICFSPKPSAEQEEYYYKNANELKYIIENEIDFELAEIQARKMHSNSYLYLQSEWSKFDVNLPKIINYVKNNPKWRISLQVHKYMKIP